MPYITSMQSVDKTLQQFGLTQSEVAVYLAGMRYPSVSVHELAKEIDIPRPTIYHALHTLQTKGLVAQHSTKGKLKFVMCPPEHLLSLVTRMREAVDSQEKSLRQLIPVLQAQHLQTGSEAITTAQYDGIEGIKTAVDIALYCKERRWDIIAPVKNFFSEFDKEYAKYYLDTRKRRGIVARTLWEKGMREAPRRLTPEEIRTRRPRVMPESMQGKLKSVFILFDDKVAIISSLQKLSAVVITSQETHDMFAAMFEGLWESSNEY